MANKYEFGGKNKARRLAKLISKAKGDSDKAKKLKIKIQAIADKLSVKGKVDKKRYTKLTDALAKYGEAGLNATEQEELAAMQDQIEADDPALTEEINDETDDDGSETGGGGKSGNGGQTVLGMPKTTAIIVFVGVVLTIALITTMIILNKNKQSTVPVS